MNQKKNLLLLGLVFAFLIGGASVLYNRLGESMAPDQLAVQKKVMQNEPADDQEKPVEETAEPERMMAPDFTVYDGDGNEVNLSDYYGNPSC